MLGSLARCCNIIRRQWLMRTRLTHDAPTFNSETLQTCQQCTAPNILLECSPFVSSLTKWLVISFNLGWSTVKSLSSSLICSSRSSGISDTDPVHGPVRNNLHVSHRVFAPLRAGGRELSATILPELRRVRIRCLFETAWYSPLSQELRVMSRRESLQ